MGNSFWATRKLLTPYSLPFLKLTIVRLNVSAVLKPARTVVVSSFSPAVTLHRAYPHPQPKAWSKTCLAGQTHRSSKDVMKYLGFQAPHTGLHTVETTFLPPQGSVLWFLNAEVCFEASNTSSAFYFSEAFNIIGLCIIKCNSLDISFGEGETSFGEELDKTGQFFLRFLWQLLLPPRCIARASNFAPNAPLQSGLWNVSSPR